MSLKRKKELEQQLTLQQIEAATLMVESDMAQNKAEKKTMVEIADKVGCHINTLTNWKGKNKAFIEYKTILSNIIMESFIPQVHSSLISMIVGTKQPSINAINTFYKLHGMTVDRQQVEQVGEADGRKSDELAASIAQIENLIKSQAGDVEK